MEGRQLTRSMTDRRLAGVCGGIAEYFDIDAAIVRIAFIVGGFLMPPAAFVVYVVLWIALPKGEPDRQASTRGSSPAVVIAEERFARGEISAQELAQIRADLGAT